MAIPENPPPQIIDHLTEIVREMVRIGGLTATIAIINNFGGRRLIFSKKSKYYHRLIDLISIESFTAYSKHFQNETVCIPKCKTAQKWLDNQELFQDMKNGMSVLKLAEKYGYSERNISILKNKLTKAV